MATRDLPEASLRAGATPALRTMVDEARSPRRTWQVTVENLARSHYEQKAVARLYEQRGDLFPAEETLLDVYRDRVAGKRVLDLGCGGGRTSARLHGIAAEYVGLDYSGQMISACRERYPDLTFVQADATDLSIFGDASFDFVLFSYNGIDTMSHGNRLKVLREVSRVLCPGGSFAFSSHNIDFRDIAAWFDRRVSLASLRKHAKNLIGYLQVRRHQVRTSDYAILSDQRAGYRQLTYFISKPNQVAQLQAAGFEDIAIISWDGRPVQADTPDRESMSFYYICRKPALGPGAADAASDG
jgi:ubiquinone/menaquinone biosynthesis C-methylase UbiE